MQNTHKAVILILIIMSMLDVTEVQYIVQEVDCVSGHITIIALMCLIDGHNDQNVVLSWYKYNTIIFFAIASSTVYV